MSDDHPELHRAGHDEDAEREGGRGQDGLRGHQQPALVHPVGDQPAVRPQQQDREELGGDHRTERRPRPGQLQHEPPEATVCIQVPTRLTAWPARKRRKFGASSAENVSDAQRADQGRAPPASSSSAGRAASRDARRLRRQALQPVHQQRRPASPEALDQAPPPGGRARDRRPAVPRVGSARCEAAAPPGAQHARQQRGVQRLRVGELAGAHRALAHERREHRRLRRRETLRVAARAQAAGDAQHGVPQADHALLVHRGAVRAGAQPLLYLLAGKY